MLRWIQMWRASQSQVLYKMARWCGAVMHRESPFFLLTSPWVTSWLTTWRPGAGCVFFLRSWWQEAWITHLASSGFVTFWTQFWRFQGFRAFCGYSLPGTAVTFNIPKVFTPLEPQQSAVNSPRLSCESQWANSSDCECFSPPLWWVNKIQKGTGTAQTQGEQVHRWSNQLFNYHIHIILSYIIVSLLPSIVMLPISWKWGNVDGLSPWKVHPGAFGQTYEGWAGLAILESSRNPLLL